MKKLTVDYPTWRCGKDSEFNSLGKGETCLWNSYGYGCCLGHIIPQIEPSLTKEKLMGEAMPACTNKRIKLLSKKGFSGNMYNTQFTERAAAINDICSLSIKDRMKKLKKLFLTKGYELEFINVP